VQKLRTSEEYGTLAQLELEIGVLDQVGGGGHKQLCVCVCV